MKDVFLVVLVTCYSTLALSYYRLPELLIYEVSEKNGEPQVNLIETQDLPVTPTYVNENDFENEVKQRSFIKLKERIHKNKDPETIKLSVPPNEIEYHLGPNAAEILKSTNFKKKNNFNLKQYDLNYKKNDYKIRQNDHKVKQIKYGHIVDYINSRQNTFSPRQNDFNIEQYDNYKRGEKTKLKNQLNNILKRLEEIDEGNGAESDGKIYVGTLTNKEVEDLFSVHPQRNTQNHNIQRTGGFEGEILNDRTDPPPPRDIYAHDYYDQLSN